MIVLPYRLTATAAADLRRVLRWTGKQFGPDQRAAYAGLIERALGMAAEDPNRIGSRDRSDLAPGVRSFRIDLAAARRGAASHIIYYVLGPAEAAQTGIVVLRILHEGMRAERHVVR